MLVKNHRIGLSHRFAIHRGSSCRVNDIHARLNPTDVDCTFRPESIDDLQEAVREANRRDQSICIAGGRHAMGGQQFAENALLIDMQGFDRVLSLDVLQGLVEVQPGNYGTT